MSGIKEIIKQQDGDTVHVTVITENGSVATNHYDTSDSDYFKDRAINSAIEDALGKD